MGFEAYKVWAADLRDDEFYRSCDDEQFTRRLSVDQFCTLALLDARCAARDYLKRCAHLSTGDIIAKMTVLLERMCHKAEAIHAMLDSGEELGGSRARKFWTADKRLNQALILDEIARIESDMLVLAKDYCAQ